MAEHDKPSNDQPSINEEKDLAQHEDSAAWRAGVVRVQWRHSGRSNEDIPICILWGGRYIAFRSPTLIVSSCLSCTLNPRPRSQLIHSFHSVPVPHGVIFCTFPSQLKVHRKLLIHRLRFRYRYWPATLHKNDPMVLASSIASLPKQGAPNNRLAYSRTAHTLAANHETEGTPTAYSYDWGDWHFLDAWPVLDTKHRWRAVA